MQEAVKVEWQGGSAVDPNLQAKLGELSEDQKKQFEDLLDNSLAFQKAADQVKMPWVLRLRDAAFGPKKPSAKPI